MKENRTELEKSVISCVLFTPKCLPTIHYLEAEHFADIKLKRLFEGVKEIYGDVGSVDVVSLMSWVKSKNLKITPLEITEVMNVSSSVTNLQYYSRKIIEHYNKQRIIDNAMYIVQNKDKDFFQLLESNETTIQNLKLGIGGNKVLDSKKLCAQFLEFLDSEEEEGLMTGIDNLDQHFKGFRAGDLVIIGARPSMGKTMLVVNLFTNCSYRGKNGLFFSLEMSENQVMKRMVTLDTGVSGYKLREKFYSQQDQELINDCLHNNLPNLNFHLDCTAGISIEELESKARILNATNKLDYILIDYLQLVTCNDKYTRDVAGHVSTRLKNLAKELKIPVIVLSQLSRAVETRGGDKIPIMADLRESGQIEQDADIIMFLWRPEYYKIETFLLGDNEVAVPDGYLRVINPKFRDGQVGDVHLLANLETQKVTSWQG